MKDNEYVPPKEDLIIASEPAVAYGSMSIARDYYDPSPYEIIQKSTEGLSFSSIQDLLKLTGSLRPELASWLHISSKTLSRIEQGESRLDPLQSEIALKIRILFERGAHTFGSLAGFQAWVREPAFRFDGLAPIVFFSTITGIQMVLDLVINIEFGSLA